MTTGSVTYHRTPPVHASDLRDLFVAAWPMTQRGDLEPFYRACGFRPTTAGLMDLRGRR